MGGDFERRPLDTVETIGQEDVFHRRSLLIPKAFRRHHKRNRSGRHRMRARARDGVGNTRAPTVRSNPRGADRLGDRRARQNTEKAAPRSEEHTSELQSLMRISYAVFCLKKKKHK